MSWVCANPHDVKSLGFWACTASFYPFMGLDIALAATPARPAYWASISVAPFLPCLWACHVDPLDLSPLPLGSYNPFTLLLPFVVSMRLLVVTPAMLAYWIYYLFSWASTAYLFYFTSYCAHEPASCHSCHVGPLGLLPFFLVFHGPFTLLLPLIVLMGLLAIIPAMLAH